MTPAIVRAAHLNVYLEVMREIGLPVDAGLARSKLPAWIEQTPDEYVSVRLMLDFLARCGHELHLSELGFLGSENASLKNFSSELQRAVLLAPTGYARMRVLMRFADREDSAAMLLMQPEADQVRMVCRMSGFEKSPYLCLAEWLNVKAVISTIRSVAGPDWHPSEITFVSPHALPEVALEEFVNTRVLVGQPNCSVVVDETVLAMTSHTLDTEAVVTQLQDVGISEAWTLANTLISVIRPYLADGHPDLARIAEIVGMSKRTLQRRLQETGSNYSDIVQQARFELARELLADPAVKLIDISSIAGYQNPQHFSRAFRRLTGVTPSSYRRSAEAPSAPI